MSKFIKLSNPAVTKEQKEFLDELRDRTGTSHAAHIRTLIQKDMDSKMDFSFDNLPMNIVHVLINAGLKNKDSVRFYINNIAPIDSLNGIGDTSSEIIMNWLEV